MQRLQGIGWDSIKAITWNFSGMAFSLVNGIITARILSPNDRGVLALAITLSTFAYLFSSVGTNVAVRTFQPSQNWASFKTYFYLSAKLLTLNLIIIVLLIFGFVYLEVIEFDSSVFWIGVLSLATFLSNQLLDTLNAVGLVSFSALLNSVGNCITMLALLAVFAAVSSSHVSLPIFAYFLGYIVRILAIILSLKRQSINLGEHLKSGEREFLRQGVKFWGVNIGQTVTFRADQLLLGALAGAHQVGIYAVAVTPTTLMQVVSNTLGQFLFRQAAIGRLTARSATKNISAAFTITLAYGTFMWLTAPFLIPLIFGEVYLDSVKIVRILLIGELFLSPYLIIVRVLSGLNRPYVASWSGLVGLFVLLPVMSLLVPSMGATGAAIGAVCCYATMTIWVSFFFFKTLKTLPKEVES